MDFFYKTKGVISIFLILIMIPLLTSAVLLVDGTRYQSAKTIIQEAGDLAAYSTIAKYNMKLKDEFGLFAIDADNDQINSMFGQYFKASLGQGDASQGGSYSDAVTAFLKGGHYKNAKFFDLYNFDSIEASASGKFPLSQPSVLQNQIIEYSKYRGIETLLERFEILSKFDKVNEETRAGQEKMAAIEHLSNIEETNVTAVSSGVKGLTESVKAYNEKLYHSDSWNVWKAMREYEECAAKEMAAMVVKDPLIFQYKDARNRAYQNLVSLLNEIVELAKDIQADANVVSSDAQRAKDSLETFIRGHADQQEAIETANQDITIINALLEPKETQYSLWYLKQNISESQASSLKNSIIQECSSLQRALQQSYTDYQSELTQAEDKETVRYHIALSTGGESNLTIEDHTNDGSTLSDYTGMTLSMVESYAGGLFENPYRVGTVNLSSYQHQFENKFLQVANDERQPRQDMDAKDAANKANNAKKDTSEEKATYKTIPSDRKKSLPSKGTPEQKDIDIPDVSEDSASSTLSSANSNASNILGKFLESSRNDILVYCYLLDNFKTRVTEKNINSNTNHSGVPGRNLADWRYANEQGELDMRYRAKKDLTTFFATNEVEYVFAGTASEWGNATIVYSWIYGTRFINNFLAVMSAYSSGDSWIRVDIDTLAAAASAATMGAVPFTVFKWVFITAWAAGETALDLALLIDDGYKIPLIKTRDTLFIRDIFKIGNAFTSEGRLNFMRERSGSQSLSDKINVAYEDYLIILMSFVGRETRLKRIADLIQLNMQERCDQNFKMSSAYTYVEANTSASIKYLFQPVKQFSSAYKGTGLKISNKIYQGY